MTANATGSVATPSTITGSSGGPLDYKEHWATLEDTLDHEEFYKLFPPFGDPKVMLEHLLDADPMTTPIGLLVLVEPLEDEPHIVPLHSVEKVRAKPGTSLCKALVGIDGDVNRITGGITMRKLEGISSSMFDDMKDIRVPTGGGISNLRTKASSWSGHYLEALADNARESELITVPKVMPIPTELLTHLVGTWYRPFELYDALLDWNKAREKPIPMAKFWASRWACAALTKQSRLEGGADAAIEVVEAPPLLLGGLDWTLPPLRDALPEEAEYMGRRLSRDLPNRYQPSRGKPEVPTDFTALTDAVKGLKGTSGNATKASPKTWEETNKYSYESLCKLQKTTDEDQFSDGFRNLISYPQKEWRTVMEQALSAAGGDSPASTPVVTKLFAENVTRGQWNTKSTERGHYELAVSIFGLVLPNSPLGKSLRDRNLAQDAVDSGTVQTTLETIKELSKAEVTLIRTTSTLDIALSMMKTFLSVYEEAEHAERFLEFYTSTWPKVRRLLDAPGDVIPSDIEEPELLIACHIARIMNKYWTELKLGRKPNLPSYENIYEVVDENKWHMIQHDIPNHYKELLKKAKAGTTKKGNGVPSGGGTSNSGPSDESNNGGPRGVTIQNPDPVDGWKEAWQGDGRTISTLKRQGNVPKTKFKGQMRPICLAWNLKGECSTACSQRESSHFTTVASEGAPKLTMRAETRQAIQTYIDGFGSDGANTEFVDDDEDDARDDPSP
mmetsp:Transcript_18923/g.45684  ORF Transcript_18923/g.45684 Transcript_18923/m.45684 type:complete len:729 (+) Transcript_18923:236-2422(+)|eukprot:CAMPEP_0113456862 /NCGR_PEP_ID=MMETSP0014_2-20120614/9108_1 /TAXON_ID=2857 /ORGANISM="Nitzschia sp." /LENGTH=728 /DNA_ID=CAMNT_0000348333 /DNA_START=226 /DNA_END=2412 /DNA_ORIENTATION=+ /assembly_acc=CAM_ASM_000159